MEKQEYINKFAEKLSLTVEEVESEFRELYADEVLIHKDLSEDQQEQRALQRLALYYKRQLMSPAVGFEGFIIGTSDCVDIVARQKREAIELFKADPQTAISEGVTNEEGIPLDTRKEWGTGRVNNMYGKPLPENNFLRNVFGIATKSKGAELPKFFSMLVSGKQAEDESIPVFKPVRFMAIDKSNPEGDYKLNASSFTKFIIDEKMQLPKYEELVEQYCGKVQMNALEGYHSLNKEDFNRICVVEGDVSILNLEPTAFGSRIMSLEDANASLEDMDTKGVTCWLPERINIDFAEGSKVLVVGRTGQGKKKDEQGNATEEPGDVTLNVFGIYALPEYKIELPVEIQPITEENLETN